jgi:hypothetical protein
MAEGVWQLHAAREGAELIERVENLARRRRPKRSDGLILHHRGSYQDRIDFGARDDSVACFEAALHQTIIYMRDRRDGAPPNSTREEELAELWAKAGNAVSWEDPELAHRCMMKGLGWSDPEVWKRAQANGIKIGIEDMERALESLLQLRGNAMQSKVPRWFPVAGVCFAALTVIFLMYLILLGPNLTESRQNLINLLISLAVAASGAFLGGDAVAKGRIPFFKDSPITFSAVGGVGIFIVVYLILRYTT